MYDENYNRVDFVCEPCAKEQEYSWMSTLKSGYSYTNGNYEEFPAHFKSASGILQSQDDLWKFDTTTETYTQISVTGAKPSARHSHSIVTGTDIILLYGGTTAAAAADNELWKFTISAGTWTQVISILPFLLN